MKRALATVSRICLAGRIDWALMVIVALGLYFRLSAALNSGSAISLRGDEPLYAHLAHALVHDFTFDTSGRVPLYPAFLALLFWCAAESYHMVRILQSVFGVFTILLAYSLGGRLFGRPTARLLALFVAASLLLVRQGLGIMSEVLFTPLLLTVVILSVRAFEKPGWRVWVLLGVSIGLSDLTRPTLLLYPLFLLVAFLLLPPWRRLLGYGAICLFSAFLTVLPWVVHVYVKYKALLPLATSHALLWQGSPEYYHLIHQRGYTYMRIWTEVLYGPGWQARNPMGVEGDRYWTKRAIHSIAEEPIIYVRFALEKLVTYWTGDPSADWGDHRIFSYRGLRQVGYTGGQAIQLIIGRAIPIFAVIAAFLLRRYWRRLAPLYMILIFTTLLHAATHAEARLSEPFQPVLLLLLAAGFQRLRKPRLGGGRDADQPVS
jgi:4-amino-4-deoxy-L-arabinose transferase-like glycosyltransferase